MFGAPIVDLTVYGTPITQGSFDPTRHGGFRHAKQDELEWWRARIEVAVKRHRGHDAPPATGPVVLTTVFVVEKPKSIPLYRSLPTGREGDLDKLLRAVGDGLGWNRKKDSRTGAAYHVGAHAFEDDRRIVFGVPGKVYAAVDEPPGVLIRMWEVDRQAERDGWVPVPDWPGWRYVRRDALLGPL